MIAFSFKGGGGVQIKHRIAVCIAVSALGLDPWPRLEGLIEDQQIRKNPSRYKSLETSSRSRER